MNDNLDQCGGSGCDAGLPKPACACSGAARHWVLEQLESPVGKVPRVASRWTWKDYLGAVAMRWGVGRRRYLVDPGLCAIGHPGADAPVLVTANYKLSLDHLRRALDGFDAWILVLDTKGINVWCAAGKGTFGTEELVGRLATANVKRLVHHRTVVVPQLGAPGVAAHEVQKRTGFRVVYGPVRALDIPAFLRDGMRTTPAMRQVTFTLWERLVVVPVELVHTFASAALIMLGFFLVDSLGRHGVSVTPGHWGGIAALVWGNLFAGVVLTPMLLPCLPGRAFACKGAEMGALAGAALWWGGGYGFVQGLAVLLLSVAACSFLGMTFTGCTPYTSASGVRREMPWGVRLQILGCLAGLVLWLVAHFQ